MLISFIGLPGAGKGTIIKYLIELINLINLNVISVSGLLKKNLVGNEDMKTGGLVDDSLVIRLVLAELDKYNLKKANIIIDGFPRTIKQLESLDDYLKEKNVYDMFLPVYLDVSEEVIKQRIENRRNCSKCIWNGQKTEDEKCPICGATLEKREDDNEAVFKVRLDNQRPNVEKICKVYSQSHNLVIVDATKPINDIAEKIINFL